MLLRWESIAQPAGLRSTSKDFPRKMRETLSRLSEFDLACSGGYIDRYFVECTDSCARPGRYLVSSAGWGGARHARPMISRSSTCFCENQGRKSSEPNPKWAAPVSTQAGAVMLAGERWNSAHLHCKCASAGRPAPFVVVHLIKIARRGSLQGAQAAWECWHTCCISRITDIDSTSERRQAQLVTPSRILCLAA
jgi:hypothetical protein